jgi:ABC-type lipopolysaccharide export system ATPase subunit
VIGEEIQGILLYLGFGGPDEEKELKHARRAYVLETGTIVLSGMAQEIAQNPEVRRAYLGA